MAQNPNPSLLDAGQIIKRAFDGTNDRIRVETEISTINVGGEQEIVIDATHDNIAIKNSSTAHELAINADGSINVAGSTTNYALRMDNTSTASVTYVGKAVIGSATSAAVWQIKKIDQTSGLVITWAGTSDSFANVWNNRTSLTYG